MLHKLKSGQDFAQFSRDHRDDFISTTLSAYIEALLAQKALAKADVIKRANLNRVYGYQILSGKRMPTREKLIQLGFGLLLDVEGVQDLLKTAGMAPLYAKVKREVAILFCLNKGYDLLKTQAFLQQQISG